MPYANKSDDLGVTSPRIFSTRQSKVSPLDIRSDSIADISMATPRDDGKVERSVNEITDYNQLYQVG